MTGRPGRPVAAAALALALTLAVSACGEDGGAPELTVSGAYVPVPPTQDVAGGYLTIENTGEADDALISASSELAGRVQLHRTEGSTMRRADSLPVPAGGELRLDRGGSHLMLLDLSRRPAEGETVSLELRFETSDPISVDVPVEAATHTGE